MNLNEMNTKELEEVVGTPVVENIDKILDVARELDEVKNIPLVEGEASNASLLHAVTAEVARLRTDFDTLMEAILEIAG